MFETILEMNPTNSISYNFINLIFYSDLNIFELEASIFLNYRITPLQAAILCDKCQKEKYTINNSINFDYIRIMRRKKIAQIMKRI
jgi:hypothetical protein